MKHSTILSYIAVSQRRRLAFPILLFLTVIFLLLRTSALNYLNMDTLPADQIIDTSTARHSIFIKAPVSRLYYSGEDYWSGGQLSGHIYYALLGDTCQYYVVNASAGRPADEILEHYTVTGRIDAFGDEFQTLTTNMAKRLNWTASSLKDISSSYFINETVYLNQREIFLLIVLSLTGAATLVIIGGTVVYWIFPKLTPAYRKLHKYGDADEILEDAEAQLMKRSLIRTRDMVLTSDYLVEFSGNLSAIIPLESVLWTYDHAALRYTLRGKMLSYTIHVVTVYGDEYSLKQKSAEDVQVIYNELTTRFPNYFYGYSKEHQQLVRHIISELNEEE